MSSGRVARRLPALALVAAVHAAALLLLITITRTHLLRVSPAMSPLPVMTPCLCRQIRRRHRLARRISKRTRGRARHRASARLGRHRRPHRPPRARVSLTDLGTPALPPRRRPARMKKRATSQALLPRAATPRSCRERLPPSFTGITRAPIAWRPEWGWHRHQPHGRCRLVVVGLVPLPTCDLEKTPARGDLFEHMRDARELGARRTADDHRDALAEALTSPGASVRAQVVDVSGSADSIAGHPVRL